MLHKHALEGHHASSANIALLVFGVSQVMSWIRILHKHALEGHPASSTNIALLVFGVSRAMSWIRMVWKVTLLLLHTSDPGTPRLNS